jgi:hypothetical protein
MVPFCGWLRSVVFLLCLAGELLAERGEGGVLGWCWLVAAEGSAVSTEVVGLAEFPDLVAEGVLEGVPSLLAESVGPDVAVYDEEVAVVAEGGEQVLELRCAGPAVGGAAQVRLGCGADAA